MILTTRLIAELEKVPGQFVQAHRVQVKGAQRDVIIHDGLAFPFAQQLMNALSRGRHSSIGFPEF